MEEEACSPVETDGCADGSTPPIRGSLPVCSNARSFFLAFLLSSVCHKKRACGVLRVSAESRRACSDEASMGGLL